MNLKLSALPAGISSPSTLLFITISGMHSASPGFVKRLMQISFVSEFFSTCAFTDVFTALLSPFLNSGVSIMSLAVLAAFVSITV